MKHQHFRQICVCSLVGLLAAIAQGQTTWYVDDDAPNDPGPGDPTVSDPAEDGSPQHPFDAIQEGIDAAAAANSDDVLVLDGTYTGPGNKDLDFGGKAITVRSENGPNTCIIDCEASWEDPHRGFYFDSGETDTSVVDGFTITNGYADYSGGGIYCSSSSPTITNCTIEFNLADYGYGGGIDCVSSSPMITNCTIMWNGAHYGGGIHSSQSSSPTITNCVLEENSAPEGPEIALRDASALTVSYSRVPGGEAAAYVEDGCTLNWGECNIIDPSLSFVDAGSNSAVPADVTTDIEGNPRFADDPWAPDCPHCPEPTDCGEPPIVDMGAYEWPALITYVDDDAPNDPGPGDPMVSDPDEDGSLEHPFDAIQEGIDAAAHEHGVVVLDGTYTGPGNKDLDFGGKAIILRSTGGPDNCIIDCEASEEDPHRGFYFHSGETDTSVVDGFTIQNGHATSASAGGYYGGGIFCDFSSPTVTNCTIMGSTAYRGGGIYCYSYSSPTIINCTITGNTTESGGAGIYCEDSSNPTITHCTITGNMSLADCGGGISCTESSPTITNCTITGNGAGGYYGGGICCYSNSSPTITNCTISSNEAVAGGGVQCWSNSHATFTNCTISGNYGDADGGGVCCFSSSSPTITNCTIRGNRARGHGGGIHSVDYSNPTITNCTITGNTVDSVGGGICCGDYGSPTLTNCTILGNTAGEGAGIYCEDYSNPTISNCTITGNTAATSGGGIYCCWHSHPMITNCILWENSAPQGPEIALASTAHPSTLTVSYSDVQGGEAAAYVESGCTLVWGECNIDADPLLLNDLGLFRRSPCLDAGSNDAVPADVTTDLDGNPRFVDIPAAADCPHCPEPTDCGEPPIVDMGAYERQPLPDGDCEGVPLPG